MGSLVIDRDQTQDEGSLLPPLRPRGHLLRRPEVQERADLLHLHRHHHLDNFITSDTTEDQIVQFAKELCHALGSLLGASLEEQCNALMESQLPVIIDGLVNDNLNPQQVCTNIAACP